MERADHAGPARFRGSAAFDDREVDAGDVLLGRAEAAPVALIVLGDLVEAGVPPQQALDAVARAMARGSANEALLTLPDVVRRLIRDGQSPADAARAAGIGRGRPGGPPTGAGPPAGVGGPPFGQPPVPPGTGRPEGVGPDVPGRGSGGGNRSG